MSYVRTFLPWIVFALIPARDWQWAALAAFVLAAGLIVRQRRAGRGADALIMEIGSAVFFAALAVLAFADPGSGLHPYSAAISSAVLSVIAAISLLVRRPFTLGIAKQSAPREVWSRRGFVRANVVITSVWMAAFAVTAATLAWIEHAGHSRSLGATLVQIAGLVVPILFTGRYVAHVQSARVA
jgi:hypothetical protein